MRLLLGALLVLAPACAQWIKYPTDGVPKTADGKPDFSGMWLPSDELPCPKMTLDDAGTCEERVLPSRQAANIAFGIPGGLPFQPWALELQKKRAAAGSSEDPHTHCLPSSFP